MMKAEIASEMIKSRTQTPIPFPGRTTGVDAGGQATVVDRVTVPASPLEVGSENVPGIHSLLYTEPSDRGWGLYFSPVLRRLS